MKVSELIKAVNDSLKQANKKAEDVDVEWVYLGSAEGSGVDGIEIDKIEIKDDGMTIYLIFET